MPSDRPQAIAGKCNAKALAHPLDRRQQGCPVSHVAGNHPGGYRPTSCMDDQSLDYPRWFGAKLLEVATLAQRLTARAVERARGGIHEQEPKLIPLAIGRSRYRRGIAVAKLHPRRTAGTQLPAPEQN